MEWTNAKKNQSLNLHEIERRLGPFLWSFSISSARRYYVCNIFIKVITRKGAYTTCGSGMRFFLLRFLFSFVYTSGGCSVLALFKHCSRSRRQSSHTHTNNFPPYLNSNKSIRLTFGDSRSILKWFRRYWTAIFQASVI